MKKILAFALLCVLLIGVVTYRLWIPYVPLLISGDLFEPSEPLVTQKVSDSHKIQENISPSQSSDGVSCVLSVSSSLRVGEPVTVSWTTTNADYVKTGMIGDSVLDQTKYPPTGSKTINFDTGNGYTSIIQFSYSAYGKNGAAECTKTVHSTGSTQTIASLPRTILVSTDIPASTLDKNLSIRAVSVGKDGPLATIIANGKIYENVQFPNTPTYKMFGSYRLEVCSVNFPKYSVSDPVDSLEIMVTDATDTASIGREGIKGSTCPSRVG